MKISTSSKNLLFISGLTGLTFFNVACNSSDDPETSKSYTITIGVFNLESDQITYTATSGSITLFTQNECQSWSRTSIADQHNEASHLHFNAASNVTYDKGTTSVEWTEFGPELDQTSIDATCAASTDGAEKSANTTGYFKDKEIYLKITEVVES